MNSQYPAPVTKIRAMQTMTVKLFKNAQSQAVRIPKPFQFTETEETVIRRSGNTVIIPPSVKAGSL